MSCITTRLGFVITVRAVSQIGLTIVSIILSAKAFCTSIGVALWVLTRKQIGARCRKDSAISEAFFIP